MKKSVLVIAISVSILAMACKGNPQGAMGVNDKPDTTGLDSVHKPKGTAEAEKAATSKGSIGPGKDKTHVADSEHEKKH